MKCGELKCGDLFKYKDRTYITAQTFGGSKAYFRIDEKGCASKDVFDDIEEVEYTSSYEYNNPYLSNIGRACRLDSAPIGQPLYVKDTGDYIIKYTMTFAFWVSGEKAGLMTIVNVDNPMVIITDRAYFPTRRKNEI